MPASSPAKSSDDQAAAPTRNPTHMSGRLPLLPRAHVARTRLWERLEAATHGAVTLVVAPVGAGKTLGVAGWLHHSGRADSTVWVNASNALDAVELRHLLMVTRSGAGFESPAGNDGAAGMGQEPRPGLLVIDDAQRLPVSSISALDHELNEHPERLNIILLSQWDVPLTRLVPELLGHLTVLRGDVLRLTDSEAVALVTEHARTDSADVAAAIMSRAEGWCAAVVLTAKAAAASPDPLAAVSRFRAGGPSVADRVASEVFAALQPRERHVLLCVTAENTVTPAVAAYLSHDPWAGEILSDLETTGLLVTRHDDKSMTYRIHPLLLEVVRRRIVAGGVDVQRAKSTVMRAARLDAARGETDRIFPRLVAIDEPHEAAKMLALVGPSLVLCGQGAAIHAFARRYPEAIEACPRAWMTLVLERWFSDDTNAARHWMDRVLAVRSASDQSPSTEVACIRLMRARLGLEPIAAAVEYAQRVEAFEHRRAAPHPLLPQMLLELGVAQNWLGDLADAETNLTSVVRMSRARGLRGLSVQALSHLAMTQYMQGREHACIELANETREELRAQPWQHPTTAGRAEVARELALMQDLPWATTPTTVDDPPRPIHDADLTTKSWAKILRARQMLLHGSVTDAERALEAPLEAPEVSRHLRVIALVERAVQATLSSDRDTLAGVSEHLDRLGAPGEGAFVAALRADLLGDTQRAASLFETAATGAAFAQPATMSMALACRAQLLDTLGEPELALRVLRDAVTATEVRRNAIAFLGWSRHGTPMRLLLQRLDVTVQRGWLRELVSATSEHPGLASFFGPVTATPQEKAHATETAVRPALSPREREVLYELARGSTYADIAANLFVSENTVKTHVSSLYGKLAVRRRSEALAVARTFQLI